MPSKPRQFILAARMDEAQQCASENGLGPKEWVYAGNYSNLIGIGPCEVWACIGWRRNLGAAEIEWALKMRDCKLVPVPAPKKKRPTARRK